MTQWRGLGWPTVNHNEFVFTAAETAEMFHRIVMDASPEIYEEKQQQATAAMNELVYGPDGAA